MMPVQLQIIAILLAVIFFILTIKLIRGGHAETRQMIKWLILAAGLLIGALFPKKVANIAHFFRNCKSYFFSVVCFDFFY